jgi:hypothetical protein
MGFTEVVIPTDLAWSTWTLSGVTNSTVYIALTPGTDSGTAISPAYDTGSGNDIFKLAWIANNPFGLTFEAKIATTSAGLTAVDYFDIRNDCVFKEDYRERFVQFRGTFARNVDTTSPELYKATYSYATEQVNVCNDGFNQSGDGARPTKDGRFKGRLYTCARCQGEFRRHEMVKQKGFLVCRDCKDEPSYKK